MNSQPSISFVLPAYNEQENIIKSIDASLALPFEEIEVIVVDDGSTDKTNVLVKSYSQNDKRIQLVTHSSNRGYGAALTSGFDAATGQYIFFTDSDLQFSLNEVYQLWSLRNTSDIVVGYRFPRNDPRHRKFNAWAWGKLVRILTGIKVQDINCAFKLFRSEVIKSMDLKAQGAFINTEILAKAMSSDYRITELPVKHYPRLAGQQTGANPMVVAKAFWELFTVYREI